MDIRQAFVVLYLVVVNQVELGDYVVVWWMAVPLWWFHEYYATNFTPFVILCCWDLAIFCLWATNRLKHDPNYIIFSGLIPLRILYFHGRGRLFG